MPRPVKRSFKIAGHRTSISLEAPFWDALRQAAEVEHTTVAAIVAAIDKERGASGLSSAVRVWVLDFFRTPRAGSSGDAETGQRTTLG
ncbi:MAG: ribbon-helix-helix domain-containing protein [Hyphomicrobium sp.]